MRHYFRPVKNEKNQFIAESTFVLWIAADGSTCFGQTSVQSPTTVHFHTPCSDARTSLLSAFPSSLLFFLIIHGLADLSFAMKSLISTTRSLITGKFARGSMVISFG